MAKKTDCRHGQHRFVHQAGVGAGIRRNVCQDCGTVAIMLTDEAPVTTVSSRLIGGHGTMPPRSMVTENWRPDVLGTATRPT